MKKLILTAALLAACLLCACGNSATDSGDPEYEAQTIAISGLQELGEDGDRKSHTSELQSRI